MKRIYYLTRSLASAVGISRDLEAAGIGHNRVYVKGRETGPLQQADLHTTSFWEDTDILHVGFFGAVYGLVAGLLVGLALVAAQPWGVTPGSGLVVAMTLFGLCLGAWFGGLFGISSKNHHLAPYLDDVQRGEYLLMVDADDQQQEQRVRQLMDERHREARMAGEEEDYSPFF